MSTKRVPDSDSEPFMALLASQQLLEFVAFDCFGLDRLSVSLCSAGYAG